MTKENHRIIPEPENSLIQISGGNRGFVDLQLEIMSFAHHIANVKGINPKDVTVKDYLEFAVDVS